MTEGNPWYCRVCEATADDVEPRKDGHNVIALPCGHEQPTDEDGYRGLGYHEDIVGYGGANRERS